jgi:uncharacterized protein (DUF1330 family)
MFDRQAVLTATTSIVLGAGLFGAGAFIGSLHAQGNVPSYLIAMVNVKDMDGYTKEFLPKAQAGLKENGGQYIAGGMNKTTAFAGEQPPNRVVILKFPNLDAIKKFEASENGKKLREEVSGKYAEWKGLFAVEGLEAK